MGPRLFDHPLASSCENKLTSWVYWDPFVKRGSGGQVAGGLVRRRHAGREREISRASPCRPLE